MRLFFWSLTASLAGFLFGFDTVVISGAEQTVQELWGLSDGVHGLAMSMALWGTVIGALTGSWPADRFGRRPTLIAIGLLYFVSALGSAFAPEALSFMVARFVGGLGVGISTVVAPIYISEIAPAATRGRLTGLFQLNIVVGILAAFLSNATLSGLGPNDWRWMLGIEAVPALVYLVLTCFLPESPRWRVGLSPRPREATTLFAPALRTPMKLAFAIALFNQLSGINAVLYFAPRIFELAGLGEEAALIQSAGIGAANLVFTLAGLWLIDRAGRRTLLTVGSVGYVLSLGATALSFATGAVTAVPLYIFAFIGAHAIGQGAVIWVFIAEVFPDRYRARGQALGSGTHWVLAATLTLVFPAVVSRFSPAAVFGFFCTMMVVQLLWVRLVVPETKGQSLDALQRELVG